MASPLVKKHFLTSKNFRKLQCLRSSHVHIQQHRFTNSVQIKIYGKNHPGIGNFARRFGHLRMHQPNWHSWNWDRYLKSFSHHIGVADEPSKSLVDPLNSTTIINDTIGVNLNLKNTKKEVKSHIFLPHIKETPQVLSSFAPEMSWTPT